MRLRYVRHYWQALRVQGFLRLRLTLTVVRTSFWTARGTGKQAQGLRGSVRRLGIGTG